MIKVQSFTFNDFQENTYVLYDETKECIIIDPGCQQVSEQKLLSSFISDHQLVPVKLVNTHCHIDHVLGNHYVYNKYQVPFYLHRDELKTYAQAGQWAQMFGLSLDPVPDKKVFVDEGEQMTFGHSALDIFFTPGHSIASLVFYGKADAICIAGDVLFRESIGRTDLPGGDFDTLIRSIRSKLFVLPDETKVFPGHGDPTTIMHEKRHSPFLAN